MIAALLPILAPIIGDVVNKVVPDSNKKAEVEREIKLSLLDHSSNLEKMRGNIVLAEAKSQSWITASWRPLLMLVCICIIAINYLFFPLVAIFHPEIMTHRLALPEELWNLLTLGVGGYIVGRSGEKMVDKWTGNKK
jgi:hypothetical protein|tara:strand:+ start:1666 stop:2076 length:411 start_codon:yes stop_codon:yes gene_type:complete